MRKLIKFNRIFLFLVLIVIMNLVSFRADNFVLRADSEQLNIMEQDSKTAEAFVYTRDERRDPFVSLINKTGDYKDEVPNAKEEMMDLIKFIKIGGIIWDDEMPLAMINNNIHKTGDIVNNLTIKQITSESVTFSYADLTHTITIIEKKDF